MYNVWFYLLPISLLAIARTAKQLRIGKLSASTFAPRLDVVNGQFVLEEEMLAVLTADFVIFVTLWVWPPRLFLGMSNSGFSAYMLGRSM